VELVALRVPAEIIVIVEHQDPSVRTHPLAVEKSCGKAANASSNDDQVEGFRVTDWAAVLLSIPHRMRHFPRSIVAAPHTCFRRRVIPRLIFWCVAIL
jgi:hypothetical protein